MAENARRYFEDVELGDELGPMSVTIPRSAVVGYCNLSQYPMPNRFTDDYIAQKEGMKAAVIPAPLTMGFMSLLVSRWAKSAFLKSLDVILRGPIGHDERLMVVGIVTDKSDIVDEPLIHCDIYIETEEGVKVAGGQAVAELPLRPL